MTAVYEFLSTLYAILAVFPFVSFIVIWFIAYVFIKDKKVTTRLTVDITTLLLIGSVSLMWNKLFQTAFGFWLIVLVMLVAFGVLGGYQARTKGEADLMRSARAVWRLSFLALSALYVLLFLLNIMKNFILHT